LAVPKILLDEIDAGVAQDVVGRGDVKKELRHAECQQQRSSSKTARRSAPECEHHFLVRRAVDRNRGRQLPEIYAAWFE
jgi:hypothetical protein